MNKQDALSLLKEDHDRVRALLDRLTHTTERGIKTRIALRDRIAHEIDAHRRIEEEIFYPALRDAANTKADDRRHYEYQEEHHAADRVLSELKRANPTTSAFGGKANVLHELIAHHADREESEMFPRARELFTKQELEMLGERMAARKHDIERGRAWDTTRHAPPP